MPADIESLYRQGVIGDDQVARLRDTMTHEAEGPDPAQPYLDRASQCARSGLGFATGGLQGAGMPMPDWMRSNPVQRALQNPDNAAAMGMANPTPVIAGKGMLARFNDLVAQGYGRQAIADELGIGKASVGRQLAKSGQKTAAAENPSFWEANPDSIDQMKTMLKQGMSHAKIAEKLGTSPGNVSQKVSRLLDAGELPDYVERGPSFWESPDKQEEFKQLVNEGWSQGDIASKLWGGPGGKHPRRGSVSERIKEFQQRGELQDYVPQGGTGLTPAGRTPSLPQTRFMQGEAPQSDPDIEKALIQYLRSKGLHAELGQLQQFG